MKNIENYVLLAEASYSDFSKIDFKLPNISEQIENAIIEENDGKDESKSGLAAYPLGGGILADQSLCGIGVRPGGL